MDQKKAIIIRIAKNAIILALYVVLTFVSYPIAYNNLQFRLSELLVLLCFFNRDYIAGITLGCFLCNIASPFMPWDLFIGTLATFISCLIISFMKHLALASLIPIIFNAFLVGVEYYLIANIDYWYSVGIIALGESVVIVVAYILCMILLKKESIQKVIGVKRNAQFKW